MTNRGGFFLPRPYFMSNIIINYNNESRRLFIKRYLEYYEKNILRRVQECSAA